MGDNGVQTAVCRLCGAQDDGRMLHLNDTFSMLGVTSDILSLLTSISVLIKVQEDYEVLMPQYLCISCFNTTVDIQAFVDSAVNFQKTTIAQIFPNVKWEVVDENFSPVSTTQVSSKTRQRPTHHIIDDNDGEDPLEGKSQQIITCYESSDAAVNLTTYTYSQKSSDKDVMIENSLKNHTHLLDGYQEIDESKGSPSRVNVIQIADNPVDKTTPTEDPESHSVVHDKNLQACYASQQNKEDPYNTSQNVINECSSSQNGSERAVKRADSFSSCCKNDCDHTSGCENIINGSSGIQSGAEKQLKECSTCGKKFSRQSQLKSHLVSHSEHRPYECKICHVSFKYRRNLTEHSSIHDKFPSFICSVCGLTFKQRSNLLKHERTHRDNYKLSYGCKLCSNSYSQSSHLKTHMKNSHGDARGYTCSECNVVVLCQSSLRRHMATVHANTKKFMCPSCNKGFNNYQNYQGHVRRHTGERPYSCTACTKTFTTSKALSRHRLIHQGAKNHKCSHCGKAFLELCDLKKHVKRHVLKRGKRNVKSPMNSSDTSAQMDNGVSSLNLMVLTDSLLFSEPQQILENSGSTATEVIIPHDKIDAPKGVTAEPVLEAEMVPGDRSNLQTAPMELAKDSHVLAAAEGVITPSPLLPTTQVLSEQQDMAAVSLLANTALLHPPEGIEGMSNPLDPSRVLHSTNIEVQEVIDANENNRVSLSTEEATNCSSVPDTPTVLVLSSDYLSVSNDENNEERSVMDGRRPQQSERVLSHATW